MIDLNEIKSRYSIYDLVSRIGFKIYSSGFIKSIYKNEVHASLKLYLDTNSYFDFSTNTGGDIFKFYMDYYKVSFSEAVKELAALSGIAASSEKSFHLKRIDNFSEEKLSEDIPKEIDPQIIKTQIEIFHTLYDFCSNSIDSKIIGYLKGKDRGLNESTIKKYKLFTIRSTKTTIEFLKYHFNESELRLSGLFSDKNYFIFSNHRIVIPYIENKNIVYLRGRFFTDSPIPTGNSSKYIGLVNRAGNLTAKRLFNIDSLRSLAANSDLMTCEGEFDSMILTQNGFNAVGIPGVSNFPKSAIPLLQNFNLYLAFDNDGPGEKAVKEIAAHFDKPIKQIKLRNFKDITELVTHGNS